MILLERDNLFKGYSDLLLLGVYSDKVSAEIVRKEKDGVKAVASVTEPLEGDIRENGAVNAEKIRLNCEKAIQQLPSEMIAGAKNMACVLGGAMSELSFSAERKIRGERDKDISAEEIAVLVSEKSDSTIVEKRFLVDGFAIENPVGINGKEITALIARAGWDGGFEKVLSAIAVGHKMRYEGALEARLAFIKSSGAPRPKDYCVIFIFNEEATICVIRGGFISAVADIEAGYGIIIKRAAQALGVGIEEGKSIIGKFENNKIDKAAIGTIKTALEAGVAEVASQVRATLSTIDKENLLPGHIFVVISDDFPELKEALTGAQWLSGLPIDRNASVIAEHFNLLELLN